MTRIFVFIFVSLLALPVFAEPSFKIGYVDLQAIVMRSEEGKREAAQLKKDFDVKQKKLDALQEEVKKLKEDFDKQQAMLKDDARQKRQADMQAKFSELQQTYMGLQKDLAEKQQSITTAIITKAKAIVEKIGDRDGYTAILDRNEQNILYYKRHMDVTDEVLTAYNAQTAKK